MRLLDYIKGHRRGTEAHRLEKEAMSDPFLSEALEGFESVEGNHLETIERLRRRVEKRSASRNRNRFIWAAAGAAAVVLLLTIGNRYLFREYNPNILSPEQIVPYLSESTAPDRSDHPLPADHQTETHEMAKAAAEPNESLRIRDNQASVPDEMAEMKEDIFFSSPSKQVKTASGSSVSSSPPLDVITGKVTDESGAPMAGVTVISANTPEGAITDQNGEYSIQTQQGDTLAFSFIGYERQASQATGEQMDVVLQESYIPLDKVVVTGITEQKSGRFTGATAQAVQQGKKESSRAFSNVPAADPVKGMDDFRKYIKDNQTAIYDTENNRISGQVVLEFRVNRQGKPIRIQISQSLSPEADKEARRLLKNGPDWKPTEQKVSVTIEF